MFHYRIRLAYSNGHLPICEAYKLLLTRHFSAQWTGNERRMNTGGVKYDTKVVFSYFKKGILVFLFQADIFVAGGIDSWAP